MPAARHVIAGLWSCLCPAWRPSQSRGCRIFSSPQRATVKCSHLPWHGTHIQQATTNAHPIPSLFSFTAYDVQGEHVHHNPKFDASELHDQSFIRKGSIQTAYGRLRQISTKGNGSQTRACVDIIVRERGEKPNIRLYNALLLANADQYGSVAEAVKILHEMTSQGVHPDSATYHVVLRVLAVHPDYLLRQHILEELRQRWFPVTKDGWHDVVAGLIRERQLEIAQQTLEQMRSDGVRIETWLYDMMIYALCSAEEFNAALDIMKRRLSDGELNISATLWYHLLDTASRAFNHSATLFAYRARVETFYLNPPAGMCINILSTAARHGDTYLATSVLRILGRRSGNPIQPHHYEALLETYLTANDLRTALTLLTIMSATGHSPTEATTRAIYIHLSKSHDLVFSAAAMLKDLNEQDRQIPIQAVNVVMQASIYHRDLSFAFDLYKSLHSYGTHLKPNTSSFNILFRGCAQASRKDLAMFLASEMVALKISPDTLTYDRLMLVCLNSENSIDDAWQYFEEMKVQGWWPRDGTLIALARRCCEQRDERLWDLADNPGNKGIPKTRLYILAEEHWPKAAKEDHTEEKGS